MKYQAVVIGASSGGMNALKKILSQLPESFSMPIIIVLHISASSGDYWIEVLNSVSRLRVTEADEKEKIKKGHVYVAPPNYHLLIERDQTFSLSVDEKVNFARPSIDVLFESAAFAYKKTLIGIILTGANSDGAAGIKKIKECGGLTIAQDPETAESPFMPVSAIKLSVVDHILPLEKIVSLLKETD